MSLGQLNLEGLEIWISSSRGIWRMERLLNVEIVKGTSVLDIVCPQLFLLEHPTFDNIVSKAGKLIDMVWKVKRRLRPELEYSLFDVNAI